MSQIDITNRLKKNLSKLVPLAEKHGIEAYRIYDRDIPEYPFMVDRYNEFIVVYDRRSDIDLDEKKNQHLPNLLFALKALIKPKDIIVKKRERQRVDGQKSKQYQRLSESNHRLVIGESGAKFIVNLYDYIDTGLFLDHRRIRQLVFKKCKPGHRVLNLFSYTGSISVFAALAGAKTTSVDMSKTYNEWAMDNFRENNINVKDHEFVNEDALQYLASEPQHKHDLIFLDPPTFSNSKKMEESFEVERDQVSLIEKTLRFLKPQGTLIFSNNKRSFKLDSKISSSYSIRNLSAETLPFDFHDGKVRQVFEIRLI